MNSMATSPTTVLTIARQVTADRIREAEHRGQVRAFRQARRQARLETSHSPAPASSKRRAWAWGSLAGVR